MANHSRVRSVVSSPSAAVSADERAVNRLVWLVGLSHATNHFVMLVFPAVLLLVQVEFGLGYAGVGFLATINFLCYGLPALPAGLLADRFGGERVLAVWLIGASVACVGIGFATGPWTLGVGLATLGCFASLHHPAGSGVLVELRTRLGTKVSRAFGRSGVLGNLGLASAPVLAAAIGVHWGWRAAFFVGAIPGLVFAFPLWRQPRLGSTEVATTLPRDSLRHALTLPLLLLFALETLMGFVLQGFSTFLPAHLAGNAGIVAVTAAQVRRGGAFASLALLFGALGHFAAGRLMGRRHPELLFLAAVATSSVCLFGMAVAGGPLLVLFSIVFSFAFFAVGTISNTFMAMHTRPGLGGTVFGVTFSLAFGIGSLASSTMGVVGEQLGLSAIYGGLGMVSLGGLALVAFFGGVTGAWGRLRRPH